MKEEIVAGMRNALEKGESIDTAVQTFINAGYNLFEVRAAAQMISSSGGISSIIKSEQTPRSMEKTQIKEKNGKKFLVFGIILSSLIILSAVSYLVYILLTK